MDNMGIGWGLGWGWVREEKGEKSGNNYNSLNKKKNGTVSVGKINLLISI